MKPDFNRLLSFQGILTMVALISNLVVAAAGTQLYSKVGSAVIFLNASFLIMLFSEGSQPMSIPILVLMVLSICITLAGMLFKINHWPGANVMLIYGSGAMIIVYGIRYMKKKEKGIMDKIKLVWVVLGSLSILYGMLHWGGREYLRMFAGLVLIVMMCYYLYSHISKEAAIEE